MDRESALFYLVLLLFAATGIVTLLGLVQKVSIEKKYLNALFSALILELVAAVIYLFSNTDFFAPRPDAEQLALQRAQLPAEYREITPRQMLALLEDYAAQRDALERMQRELESLGDTFASQVPPYEDVSLALDESIRLIDALQADLESLQVERRGEAQFRQNFLVRMAELNARISAVGASINLIYRPQEKREIAAMLQSAFKQIGFMPAGQEPDDDPLRAHELLVAYQQSKNFGQTGYLTSQVIALIILDYLSPVSQNGRQERGADDSLLRSR